MERSKGLTGSTLKIIAMVTMLIDHISAVVLTRMYIAGWYTGVFYNVIFALRIVGRVAFPIYCFLIVEGFLRTKNFRVYLIRMLAFALITEIPYDLALTSNAVDFRYQNVMFTMSLGLLALWALKKTEEQVKGKWQCIVVEVITVMVFAGVAELINTDYAWCGVLCICLIYVCKASNGRKVMLGNAALIMGSPLELAGLVSVPLVAAYNGERGLRLKYFFYVFYPLHLFILYMICVFMGLGSIGTL